MHGDKASQSADSLRCRSDKFASLLLGNAGDLFRLRARLGVV